MLDEQIKVTDDTVQYAFDENRFQRILIKLAKGHAGFEFDYISFDDSDIQISYDFIFNLSEADIDSFEEVSQTNLFPEVGSRNSYIVQNISARESSVFLFWNNVQENQYRYQVSYNSSGGICVKIVIYEWLYCRVDFD